MTLKRIEYSRTAKPQGARPGGVRSCDRLSTLEGKGWYLMKWFKHDVDMGIDLKIQAVIHKHGLEGYAIWCLTLELLGREGPENGRIGRIDGLEMAIRGLMQVTGWQEGRKIKRILSTFSTLGLIDRKSFSSGNLYIPKFASRVDEYTQRKMNKISGENRDNVPYYKIRTDKIRKEESKTPDLSITSLKTLADGDPTIKTALQKMGVKV